jgi:hypothetical protein
MSSNDKSVLPVLPSRQGSVQNTSVADERTSVGHAKGSLCNLLQSLV